MFVREGFAISAMDVQPGEVMLPAEETEVVWLRLQHGYVLGGERLQLSLSHRWSLVERLRTFTVTASSGFIIASWRRLGRRSCGLQVTPLSESTRTVPSLAVQSSSPIVTDVNHRNRRRFVMGLQFKGKRQGTMLATIAPLQRPSL